MGDGAWAILLASTTTTRGSSPRFLRVTRTRARSASGAKPPQLATACVRVSSASAGSSTDCGWATAPSTKALRTP